MNKKTNDSFIYNESYEVFLIYNILKQKNKEIELQIDYTIPNSSYIVDLYAQKGIPSLNLDGETIIEVKRFLSYSTLQSIYSFYEAYGKAYNILVVYFNSSLSGEPINPKSKDNSHQLLLKSYESLKSKRKKGISEENYYANKAKVDWKSARNIIIENAKRITKQDNNVLFLGAGVSKSANMPSWSELLKGLMGEVKQLKGPVLKAFKELDGHVYKECGDSNLIMARYLATAIKLSSPNTDFLKSIQKHLYCKREKSLLLSTLVSLISQKKVDEVITYNFDNILEQELTKNGFTNNKDFTSIAKDAEIKGHNTLPIYHVHGIIPEDGQPDSIVFTETAYHERYADIYHWSNVEQLHALSRKHCFFIGLSMTDPNLRRLLDVAKRMNNSNEDCHYAFLRRTKEEEFCLSNSSINCKYLHVSENLIDKKIQKDIYDFNYSIYENIFRELGVNIIWYEDYFKELPQLLAKVFDLTDFQSEKNDILFKKADENIRKISQIEEDIKGYNLKDFADINEFIIYKNNNADLYKRLINETYDILKRLTNKINIKKEEDIVQIEKNIPKYDNNISGYAELYSTWLNSLKRIKKSIS